MFGEIKYVLWWYKCHKEKNYYEWEKIWLLHLQFTASRKEFSNGKFGKGETVTSPNKEFKLLDDESGEMLDVKIRCSKKINDAMESPNPKESKKVFDQCLEELINRGLERGR